MPKHLARESFFSLIPALGFSDTWRGFPHCALESSANTYSCPSKPHLCRSALRRRKRRKRWGKRSRPAAFPSKCCRKGKETGTTTSRARRSEWTPSCHRALTRKKGRPLFTTFPPIWPVFGANMQHFRILKDVCPWFLTETCEVQTFFKITTALF